MKTRKEITSYDLLLHDYKAKENNFSLDVVDGWLSHAWI